MISFIVYCWYQLPLAPPIALLLYIGDRRRLALVRTAKYTSIRVMHKTIYYSLINFKY